MKKTSLYIGLSIGIVALVYFSMMFMNKNLTANFSSLPIPPLLMDEDPDPGIGEFHLKAQQSTKEFLKGVKSDTFGYNADYLGPVIRVRRGEKVSIKVENSLRESTTIHWHGLEVSGKVDGGPYNGIQPGEVWNPQFTVNQPAATLWFHPHPVHMTAEQVYRGLSGLIYIDDEVTDQLDIPKDYGQNDFPLIIQDRRFTKDGQLSYDPGMMDTMHGFQGDTVLVNGTINPFLEVPRGKVRLRILNGSNARIYDFHLTDSEPFWQIATDGGLLETPVKLNQIQLGPAERAEIIVDFSHYKQGEQIQLQSDDENIMKFIVKDGPIKDTIIPNSLAKITNIPVSTVKRARSFVFQGMGSSVNINGKQMDLSRIDEEVPLNDTEIWEISNPAMGMMGSKMGMAHPFHAHGVQFQILERNGKEPPENERGWKDTILVHPDETVKAIATFKSKGIFMYHCHILEHEDAGMMGQFSVR